MEAIQDLRRRAQSSGHLASDERMRVVEQPAEIVIEAVNLQYVYVAYYEPLVAYGSWGWPAYPPFYWAPWPGYARAYGPGFWWGAPVGLSVGFFFGGFNWTHRHAWVHRTDNYYTRSTWVNRQVAVTPGRWQRNYWGRSGSYARYSDPVNRTQQFQQSSPLRDSRRGWTGSRTQASPQTQFAPQQQLAPQSVRMLWHVLPRRRAQ
jgi:hypothetical protein